MKHLGYMAVDQYGAVEHLGDTARPPRAQLLDKLGAKHADKVYVDPDAKHIGYIVNKRWFTIYNVCAWEGGQA